MKESPESEKKSLLAPRGRRFLSEAVQIEEELLPGFLRPMLLLVMVMVVIFLTWAALADLAEVARASGVVTPTGQTKVVQHLDGGIVNEILVEEGQAVEEGQVLLRLDGSQAQAELQQTAARLAQLRLRNERLLALTESREPVFGEQADRWPQLAAEQREIYQTQLASFHSSLAVVERQIEQRSQRLAQHRKALEVAGQHQELTGELLAMREELAARQLITRTVLLETRRAKVTANGEVQRLEEEIAVAGDELAEARSRRHDLEKRFFHDLSAERGDIQGEIAQLQENRLRLQARVDRLEVRAPARGLTQDMQVRTLGQVIQPGAVLMEILPTDYPLEAEIQLAPRDIGHVQPGQPVKIRVSSYDYRRYGATEGVLRQISATSIIGDDGEPYFRGWVELTRPYVGDDPARNRLLPGMSVETEVITGRKTLLAYFFTPVADILARSFRER